MKRIVLASGGLDSSTLLTILPKEETVALFFDYGQRSAEKERKALESITKRLGIRLIQKDIRDVFSSSKSDIIRQNTTKIEETRHEVESRNLVFVSAAISIAEQVFGNEDVEVLLGIIKVGIPYPDCTVDFVEKCNILSQLCTGGKVRVSAPFADIGKDKVLELLKDKEILPIETWSCYYGEDKPCGRCPACIDRKVLGVDDVNN